MSSGVRVLLAEDEEEEAAWRVGRNKLLLTCRNRLLLVATSCCYCYRNNMSLLVFLLNPSCFPACFH